MFMSLTAFAMSANAQTATNTEEKAQTTAQEEEAVDAVQEVVVTGSRIRRNEFTAASPVQIITAERSTLVGQTDTTKIIQGSTTASNAAQINNNYTGYVTTGGPGTNTVSLRGLGANRTLVLLNGHRVGPAGVGGTVGPADLNTIPNAVVDRTEILKDGASSIYGSDAVAGVINIITKKNMDGGAARVVISQPEESGGEEYNLSVSQGVVQDRFHGIFTAEYYQQKALKLGDRDWSCPEDYMFYADGSRADLIDPVTGKYKCTQLLTNRFDNLSTGRNYVYKAGAVNGGGYGDDITNFHRVGATYCINTAIACPTGSTNVDATKTRGSRADQVTYLERYKDRDIYSPVTRKSINFFGGYDLTDNTEVYGEFMYNVRESSQRNFRQLFPQVHFNNPNNPFRVGNPNGYAPGYARTIITVDSNRDQEVRYLRGLVGIKGILPDAGIFKNWTWDVYAQTSRSKAIYGADFIYNDRVLATTGAVACDVTVLKTATTCPTGGVNYFRPSTVESGIFTPDEAAFIFGYEQGKTSYIQSYAEADFSGDLIDLPAGTLAASVGFVYRQESLNDNPGAQAKASNYWSSTTSGQTVGKDTVKEAFLELDIPVLKGLPFAEKLDINLSTRYSDYDSYGSNTTYKAALNWAISKEWRLRMSQGDSFRAPALYELYLANQSAFLGQSSIDPCYNLAAVNNPNATIVANCAAQGIPTNYTAVGISSATIFSGGGKGLLKAETSLNRTIGLVWTPKFAKLNVAVDFFETKIDNQVSKFGSANILYECYRSPNLSSPFCSLFNRDLNPASLTRFGITQVQDNYLNVAEQFMRGFDLTMSYEHKFDWFDFRVESENSFIRKWTYTLLNGSPTQNQLGFVGTPEYVGNLNFRFNRGDYTLNWNVNMVGESSDFDYYDYNSQTTYYASPTPVYYKMNTEFYAMHTLSLRKNFDNWSVVGTVRNVTNEQPPSISGYTTARLGNAALTSQYDQMGRTFVLSIQRKW